MIIAAMVTETATKMAAMVMMTHFETIILYTTKLFFVDTNICVSMHLEPMTLQSLWSF
ncbi:hypothetical protein PBCV1_a318L [Paramecium bursaria Chlorella virus 1]|uniref:Uncharacterized protein n=1 Tax=Paramecium bursaria Chlorella virus 1 TaxID=10506 RepID=F8TU17_PBCV1|nr:hypothetical protein PBCV1_a318L [Paramecium bursaria Chlorella virus 1]AEI70078.1 hypothetical protein [Paramecium bursaria Chlorella virus 1]